MGRGGGPGGGGGFSGGGGGGFSGGGGGFGGMPGGSGGRGGGMPGGGMPPGGRPPGGGMPPGGRPPVGGGFGTGFGLGMMTGSAMNRQSGNSGSNPNPGSGGGGGGGGGPQRNNGGRRNILIPILIVIVIIIMIVGCVVVYRSNNTGYEGDGRTRTKLDSSMCIESSQWIDDELGWITDQSEVISAMEYFYDETGVQPYLLLTDNLDGKGADLTNSEAEAYLKDLYSSLFNDQGHLIFCFVEYSYSMYWNYIYVGSSANGVIDSSAREIMLGISDQYYYDSSLTDNEYFAQIFTTSAKTLMQDASQKARTRNVIIVILVIGAVLIVVLLVARQLAVARTKKAEKTKEILDTPIGQTPENEDLLKKYGDDSDGGSS